MDENQEMNGPYAPSSHEDFEVAVTSHVIGDDIYTTSGQSEPGGDPMLGEAAAQTDHTRFDESHIKGNDKENLSEFMEGDVISYVDQHGADDVTEHEILLDPPPEMREMDANHTSDGAKVDSDLLNQIPGLYRLLEIINDGVDKAVIHHESIRKITTKLQPKSYSSMSKVDFEMLDKSTISPMGCFGSRSKLVEWLLDSNHIDDKVAHQLATAGAGGLRPGMYLLEAIAPRFYVIFWPEGDTWDARDTTDAGKNRVLFMRYLTKLCDQITCFVSDEDAAKIAEILSWNKDSVVEPLPSTRLFKRKVTHEVEQDESAKSEPGPEYHLSIPPRDQKGVPNTHSHKFIRLIGGHEKQGVLVSSIQDSFERLGDVLDPSRSLFQKLLAPHSSRNVRLGEDNDPKALDYLFDQGFMSRFSKIRQAWRAEYHTATNKILEEKQFNEQRLSELILSYMPKIHAELMQFAYPELRTHYSKHASIDWDRLYSQFKSTDTFVDGADDFVKKTIAMPGVLPKILQLFREFDWERRPNQTRDYHRDAKASLQENVHKSKLSSSMTTHIPEVSRGGQNLGSYAPSALVMSTAWKIGHVLASPVRAFWGSSTKPKNTQGRPKNNQQGIPQPKEFPRIESEMHQASFPVVDETTRSHENIMTILASSLEQGASILEVERRREIESLISARIERERQARYKTLITRINEEFGRGKKNSDTVVINGIVDSVGSLRFKCQQSRIIPTHEVLNLYELSLRNDGTTMLQLCRPIEHRPQQLLHIQFVGCTHFMTLVKTGGKLSADIVPLDSKHRKHGTLSIRTD